MTAVEPALARSSGELRRGRDQKGSCADEAGPARAARRRSAETKRHVHTQQRTSSTDFYWKQRECVLPGMPGVALITGRIALIEPSQNHEAPQIRIGFTQPEQMFAASRESA